LIQCGPTWLGQPLSRRAAGAGHSLALLARVRHAHLSFRAYGLASGASTTAPRSHAAARRCQLSRLGCHGGTREADGERCTPEAVERPADTGLGQARPWRPGLWLGVRWLGVLDLLDDCATKLLLDELHAA
jgi:hypothetical protein